MNSFIRGSRIGIHLKIDTPRLWGIITITMKAKYILLLIASLFLSSSLIADHHVESEVNAKEIGRAHV